VLFVINGAITTLRRYLFQGVGLLPLLAEREPGSLEAGLTRVSGLQGEPGMST